MRYGWKGSDFVKTPCQAPLRPFVYHNILLVSNGVTFLLCETLNTADV